MNKLLTFLLFLMIYPLSAYSLDSVLSSEQLQYNAQEHLKVEVLSVIGENFSNQKHVNIYVKARLKILAVKRSVNHLNYKYQINLNYLHSYRLLNNNNSSTKLSKLPILKEGQILNVFLDKIEGMRNTYKPAALDKSFIF